MASPSKLIGVVAVVIILAANGWILWSNLGGRSSSGGGRREQSYFTTDDGATYFADDANKLTPFDHNGTEAVCAHVYAADGKKWVAYLERYTKRGRELMEALEKKEIGPEKLQGVMLKEVKKPGDARWVTPADGMPFANVIRVVNPNRAGSDPHPVGPAD
ncbi:MAG TPA: hypothetical protein VM008_04870 [Phycisphaerae bacterium]|nr:hypothetical protein [Phycisphaerae bacterium]